MIDYVCSYLILFNTCVTNCVNINIHAVSDTRVKQTHNNISSHSNTSASSIKFDGIQNMFVILPIYPLKLIFVN